MPELNEDQTKKLEELVSIGLAESVDALLEKMIDDLWQERFADFSELPPEAINKLREMHEGIQRGEGSGPMTSDEHQTRIEAMFKNRREAKQAV